MARIPPRPPERPRRQGRILPRYPLAGWPPWLRAATWTRGCAICGKAAVRAVENDHGFCWRHRPDLAERALDSPGAGQYKAARRGVFIHKNYPDRKTCERILRLAGRTEAPPKPPRPRRRPRDRRYVR